MLPSTLISNAIGAALVGTAPTYSAFAGNAGRAELQAQVPPR